MNVSLARMRAQAEGQDQLCTVQDVMKLEQQLMSQAMALHWFPTLCPDIPVKFVLGIGKLNPPRKSTHIINQQGPCCLCPLSDLRLFPERYVVCVSCPEDASEHQRNPSLAASELSEQSRSEYFSYVGKNQELLSSPTKTKKSVLQKIAKQASVQRELCGSTIGMEQNDPKVCPKNQRLELKAAGSESSSEAVAISVLKAHPEANHSVPCNSVLTESKAETQTTQKQKQEGEHEISNGTSKSKRCKPNDDAGEDPHSQPAKRTCLGRPPATTRNHSSEHSVQTSKRDLPPLPHLPFEAKAESKAFPVSECKKTTLEVELLTPGKQAQRLPLTSNNTAETNQNRLATSLRGLSVKPASSGSSIGSRSTLGEGGSENLPRTSRLRRLKRS
ncbi:unnamed protein product [Menidia menidia]|uniref:(Atlantic silverside) hypothetical protein n=1 Tax=Menidia menidia TaxID=238744 RepID=A0A8S4BYE2_9TELE|nr:unnamed protein product [Menidia menidia]